MHTQPKRKHAPLGDCYPIEATTGHGCENFV